MHSGTYTVNVGNYTNKTGYVETSEEFRVHFNGDFSGDVIINVCTDRIDPYPDPPASDLADGGVALDANVKIPYDLLEQIVMSKLQQDLVSKVENMDTEAFKHVLLAVL
jgi:hypothetical protein